MHFTVGPLHAAALKYESQQSGQHLQFCLAREMAGSPGLLDLVHDEIVKKVRYFPHAVSADPSVLSFPG